LILDSGKTHFLGTLVSAEEGFLPEIGKRIIEGKKTNETFHLTMSEMRKNEGPTPFVSKQLNNLEDFKKASNEGLSRRITFNNGK